MKEFFRPWRRKVGVVMLVLASLFIFLLLRSSHATDQLEVPVGGSVHFITSTQGYFRWTRHAERRIGTVAPVWYTIEHGSPDQPLDHEGSIDWHWRSDLYLFDLGQGSLRGSSLAVGTFSYLIGIPLTGIAAALLILTPRKSTPKKIAEPAPVEGA